jgi:hypothetical protein
MADGVGEAKGLTRRTVLRRSAASAAVLATADVARASAAAPGRVDIVGGHVLVRSARLDVVFDGTSGGIRSVRNRVTGHQLLAAAANPPLPWRMTSQQGAPAFTPQAFSYQVSRDQSAVVLRWKTGVGKSRVEVRASVNESGELELWPAFHGDDGVLPPRTWTYPLLSGLATLSGGGAADRLIYPRGAGYLIDRPFSASSLTATTEYPDGFGSTMQVMGYFEADQGGFYFAAHDPLSTRKSIHFSQAEASYEHHGWDLREGEDMDLGFPLVLGSLQRGDWFEVAERYRRWALAKAPWMRQGPKWRRKDRDFARWLHEEVGIVVWGAPSGVDWSPWYRFYAKAAGTPIQVVPAYDWSATRPWQLGFEGYFPANFHPENVKAWKGHRVTPYENDLFISKSAHAFETDWLPNALNPPITFSMSFFRQTFPDPATTTGGTADERILSDVFYFLCPVTPSQKSLHVFRDKTLAVEDGVDGITYDISFGNPAAWMFCDRTEHGHTPGTGRWIIDHCKENAHRSREAMRAVLHRYPPLGTETICECVIDVVDYQQSRALAGPQTTFEGRATTARDPYERPPGKGIELVPFFEAVYHDHGPVIQDGWGQLSVQHGEIFYWIASRVALEWGGLYELNYEYGWPEALPDHEGEPEASFTPYDGAYYTTDHAPELDPDKAAFLGQIAAARTGFGNPWLAYGRVARPTGAASPTVTLDYHHTHDWFKADRTIAGAWDVPQLLESAWFDPRGRLGLFFVNLAKEGDLPVTVDVDAGERWGTSLRGARIRVETAEDDAPAAKLGRVGPDNHVRFSLTLPPRRIALVSVERP